MPCNTITLITSTCCSLGAEKRMSPYASWMTHWLTLTAALLTQSLERHSFYLHLNTLNNPACLVPYHTSTIASISKSDGVLNLIDVLYEALSQLKLFRYGLKFACDSLVH